MTKFKLYGSNNPEKSAGSEYASMAHHVRLPKIVMSDALIENAVASDPGYETQQPTKMVRPNFNLPIQLVKDRIVKDGDLRQASANIIEQARMEEANPALLASDVRRNIDAIYDDMMGLQS